MRENENVKECEKWERRAKNKREWKRRENESEWKRVGENGMECKRMDELETNITTLSQGLRGL